MYRTKLIPRFPSLIVPYLVVVGCFCIVSFALGLIYGAVTAKPSKLNSTRFLPSNGICAEIYNSQTTGIQEHKCESGGISLYVTVIPHQTETPK